MAAYPDLMVQHTQMMLAEENCALFRPDGCEHAQRFAAKQLIVWKKTVLVEQMKEGNIVMLQWLLVWQPICAYAHKGVGHVLHVWSYVGTCNAITIIDTTLSRVHLQELRLGEIEREDETGRNWVQNIIVSATIHNVTISTTRGCARKCVGEVYGRMWVRVRRGV